MRLSSRGSPPSSPTQTSTLHSLQGGEAEADQGQKNCTKLSAAQRSLVCIEPSL